MHRKETDCILDNAYYVAMEIPVYHPTLINGNSFDDIHTTRGCMCNCHKNTQPLVGVYIIYTYKYTYLF